MNEFEDLRIVHEVDQALAGGIATGNIRVAGQTSEGEDMYELTMKGLFSGLVMHIEGITMVANAENRDFTPEELMSILDGIGVVMGVIEGGSK